MARKNIREWSRRDFVKLTGGCAALTSTSLLSTLVNLSLTRTAVAAADDLTGYKALVCCFLHGGYDSYNALVPYQQAEYDDYAAIRTNLAIPRGDLHVISDQGGRQFGLHPGLGGLKTIFNQGDLAFVANVGSMVEPTTLADYRARRNLPLGLFSHSDEQQHWQTCVPQSRSQITGWAGRMADLMTDSVNRNPTISMNIAIGSLNMLQTGGQVVPYVIHRTAGPQLLSGYNWNNVQDRILTKVTDSLLAETYSDLLEKTHANRRRGAIDAAIEFRAAIDEVNLRTTFPDTNLGQQLNMVAKSIGAREALGQSRQIFFVQRGGWDHHANLTGNLEDMLPEVSQALAAFNAAMKELNVNDDVTLFSASDFARTLSSNGQGSDHAWGGNHFVMGGGVKGGHVYGDYPTSLAAGNSLDTGRGRLVPTTAVDEYAAELSMWFGMHNDSTLETVLPNLRNFFPAGGASGPLKFLT